MYFFLSIIHIFLLSICCLSLLFSRFGITLATAVPIPIILAYSGFFLILSSSLILRILSLTVRTFAPPFLTNLSFVTDIIWLFSRILNGNICKTYEHILQNVQNMQEKNVPLCDTSTPRQLILNISPPFADIGPC